MTEPSVAVNINTVLLTLITVSGTAFGAWLTYRANATHKAVNSERSAMTEELKKQNAVIAQLAAHLGALTGSHDLVELAHTVSAHPANLAPAAQATAALREAQATTEVPPGSVIAQIVVPGPPEPKP